jgi:hypothetical protein
MMSEEGAKEEGNVDLQQDDSLKVSIADALNEQDIVKFTVHTKVSVGTLWAGIVVDFCRDIVAGIVAEGRDEHDWLATAVGYWDKI